MFHKCRLGRFSGVDATAAEPVAGEERGYLVRDGWPAPPPPPRHVVRDGGRAAGGHGRLAGAPRQHASHHEGLRAGWHPAGLGGHGRHAALRGPPSAQPGRQAGAAHVGQRGLRVRQGPAEGAGERAGHHQR